MTRKSVIAHYIHNMDTYLKAKKNITSQSSHFMKSLHSLKSLLSLGDLHSNPDGVGTRNFLELRTICIILSSGAPKPQKMMQ